MKLIDGTDVVLVTTQHTYRTAADSGLPDIDVVEVGSIYHQPLVKPCDLSDESCEYERHNWDVPACVPHSTQDGALVRRSVAHHISEPCPKPECFPHETVVGIGLHIKGFRDEREQAGHG